MEPSADAIARLKHANELLAADAQRAIDELASARTLYQREVEMRLTAERELDRYAREVHALHVEMVSLKDERDAEKSEVLRLTELVTNHRAQLSYREGEIVGLRNRLDVAGQDIETYREEAERQQRPGVDTEAEIGRLHTLLGELYAQRN